MKSDDKTRDLLTGYLLGRIPEAEREAVESRLFGEEGFAEALEDVERDLLDAYAAGELRPQDRAAVESRLLASEAQRQKLRFARTWSARQQARRSQRVWRGFAIAAAIAVFLIGGQIFLRHWSAPKQKATGPVAAVPSPDQRGPAPVSEPAPVFAALLSSSGLRDGGVQQVRLPAGADRVRLDLELRENRDTAYSVRLVRQRETVFEQSGLAPHLEAGNPVMSVAVRSSILERGLYRLIVTGSGPRTERLTYNFEIR